MNIRIVNTDGIGRKTEITDAETGEEIGGIREATIHCSVEGLVTAEFTFNIPAIDIFAIAKLSDNTKKELKNFRNLLERIEREEII